MHENPLGNSSLPIQVVTISMYFQGGAQIDCSVNSKIVQFVVGLRQNMREL